MGNWRHQGVSFWLGVSILSFAPASLAQPGCSNDLPLIFRDEAGGIVTLNDATVRNVTGSNNDDRSIPINNGGNQTATLVGDTLVAQLDPDNFPVSAVRAGFNRNVRWQVNFPNQTDPPGYVFANRSDIAVTITGVVDGARVIFEGTDPSSSAEVEGPTQRGNTQIRWFGSSNTLRRLRGNVRLRFTELQMLARAGVHSTRLSVCVEVTGNIPP